MDELEITKSKSGDLEMDWLSAGFVQFKISTISTFGF